MYMPWLDCIPICAELLHAHTHINTDQYNYNYIAVAVGCVAADITILYMFVGMYRKLYSTSHWRQQLFPFIFSKNNSNMKTNTSK